MTKKTTIADDNDLTDFHSVAISAANIRYTEARPIRNWRAIIGNYRTMEAKAQAAVDAELAELAASITQREP